MDCFVYGTLRHIPHLNVVLGRDASDLTCTPDALPGYAVYTAFPGLYPIATVEDAAAAPGLRIGGLSRQDRARLAFYEDVFGYTLEQRVTESGTPVEVFVPGARTAPASDTLWELGDWIAQRGALTCLAAEEVMSLMGRMPPEDVLRQYPRILARAQSRLNARSSKHGALTLPGRVENSVRLPLVTATEPVQAEIKAAMVHAGLIN